MNKKRRRNYPDEFKEEAVRLIIEQGYSMPIRLLHIAPSVSSRQPRMASRPVVQVVVGRCRYPGGNFQYTIECHQWPESTIKTEYKFVEISL